MEISGIYSSGILNKGEELVGHFKATFQKEKDEYHGSIVFTNKRFLFLQKPSGWRARGFNVRESCSWADVLSVSTTGLIHKKLNLSIRKDDRIEADVLSCDKVELVAQKIVENRNSFVEQKVVEAKTVLIEEANRDKASDILQKRLARGEITLEEFHDKIQRI